MDLDVAQVRAFVAVAEHHHFGRAASSLHLSQQAVSKRIARLEQVVGPLLSRGRTGVSLTRRGERLLPHARDLLSAADAALAIARDPHAEPLRVDVWGHLHPLLPVVRSFASARPELVVEISMRRDLQQALDALARGEIDLASGNLAGLDRGPAPDEDHRLVACTPIVALISERSPLVSTDTVARDTLRSAVLWWPLSGSSPELASFAAEYARSMGAELAGGSANLGLEVLLDQVEARPDVVSFVGADWPIPDDARVRRLPLDPVPLYPWYVIWRRRSAHPMVAELLAALRAADAVPKVVDERYWLPAAVRTQIQPHLRFGR
jgi:DNA-binding transcriptional LysR family regulator